MAHLGAAAAVWLAFDERYSLLLLNGAGSFLCCSI
jgi:hypothetical protein